MFKLVIQDDEGKTTVVPLIRDEITIGRKEGNTIRLTERNVSRRHARILRNNGEVQIEDLGSYNGIRVNNARIAERVSLRVSDQVQIGDYKLYLKAEGVEQVDDARTMPIERVDTSTATDVIAAVGAGSPTTPMAVPPGPAPGQLNANAQLVGNPNRTLVAIADTDPQGRPVASAAAVAAMTSPMGYGKLVVLSSNFAGKEFELSRPQMIIGRTDENDIVVNHRSISRNHAKLVREPDTGRYTISDLQSSNGVRVNGQDYGKVELRRGDVVDLGHVRLRFVEPGEDFVFARDAVITDVPDVGGKRGLLVAIVLGVLVLAGVVAFIALKDRGGETKVVGGSNDAVIADADLGTVVAVTPDAAEARTVEIDAGQTVQNDSDRVKVECLDYQDKGRWSELGICTERLKKFDPALARTLNEQAISESKAETQVRVLATALNDKSLKKAKLALDMIPEDSVYRNDAKRSYDAAEKTAIDDLVKRAKSSITPSCKDFVQLMKQESETKPLRVVAEAKRQVGCKVEAVVIKDPGGVKDPPPVTRCDAEALNTRGQEAHTSGNPGAALKEFEAAYACRADGNVAQRAFISACNSRNSAKAKVWFKKLNSAQQTNVASVCMRQQVQYEGP